MMDEPMTRRPAMEIARCQFAAMAMRMRQLANNAMMVVIHQHAIGIARFGNVAMDSQIQLPKSTATMATMTIAMIAPTDQGGLVGRLFVVMDSCTLMWSYATLIRHHPSASFRPATQKLVDAMTVQTSPGATRKLHEAHWPIINHREAPIHAPVMEVPLPCSLSRCVFPSDGRATQLALAHRVRSHPVPKPAQKATTKALPSSAITP